jgi:hypothetical protein
VAALRDAGDLAPRADPFLLNHYVAPCSFDVGGPISPISIRDQMLRGQLIVDRAMATKPPLIDTGRRSLLVVGAGVAGVTAAIHAARRGVRVTLVDWADAPFGRQASCPTRYLDPTQYDWPLGHWRDKAFPLRGRPHPLAWSAAPANWLAVGWHIVLLLEDLWLPNLEVKFGTTVDGLPSFGRLYRTDAKGATALSYEHVPFGGEGEDVFVQVHLRERLPRGWWPPAAPQYVVHPVREYGMLLTSVGFGRERIEAKDPSGQHVFRSLEFWEPDDFESGQLGGMPADQARVLISGSGDGALQDLLRILTRRRSAGDLFEEIAGPMGNRDPGWLEIERKIHEAEDQAQRALAWGPSGRYDHDVLSTLHQAHLAAVARLAQLPLQTVDEACGAATIWDQVRCRLDRLFAALTPSPPHLTFTYSCDHFSCFYALNRFLVLVLLKYLAEMRNPERKSFADRIAWHQDTGVRSVAGVHHACAGNARACHGQEHDVVFINRLCDGRTVPPATAPLPGVFDVLVLRHGVELAFSSLPLVNRPRQVLPYDLPA